MKANSFCDIHKNQVYKVVYNYQPDTLAKRLSMLGRGEGDPAFESFFIIAH